MEKSFVLKHAVSEDEIELVRNLYEASFPAAEKKPFEWMLQKREEGFFEILMMENGQREFCGLAIMLLSGGLALLDYLAIVPERQGGGLGSNILQELQARYGRDRIVVEIESTVGTAAEAAENREDRLRRKAFYLRNGLVSAGLSVDLMGVEMEVLTYGRKLTFLEYYAIYGKVLPENMANKVRPV